MSILFFDGFDFYNSLGPGGRKWDQGSSGEFDTGRFSGQALKTGRETAGLGTIKTLPTLYNNLIIGFAMNVINYTSSFGLPELPTHPFLTVYHDTVPQMSFWLDHDTQTIQVRQGRNDSILTSVILDTHFVPPLTLWYYIEFKINTGGSGSIEIRVNGNVIGTSTGFGLGVHGVNKLEFNSYNNFSGGAQGGKWFVDDLYVLTPDDLVGSIDFLGEVRVQTKYPDAEGFENDFIPSIGSNNANNVNTPIINYIENGHFNFSGTVGAIDLYSIQNFSVSGQVFAVQENLSVRKDDVGNRNVSPLLRTAAVNYSGSSQSCFSNYTFIGQIWEVNPGTLAPWTLTDLNSAEFGLIITS